MLRQRSYFRIEPVPARLDPPHDRFAAARGQLDVKVAAIGGHERGEATIDQAVVNNPFRRGGRGVWLREIVEVAGNVGKRDADKGAADEIDGSHRDLLQRFARGA